MTTTPDDLEIWRRLQDAGEPNPWSQGVRLLAPDERPAVLDTDYLTDADRANPDVMANVRAIDETAALVAWAAQDENEDRAWGYWHGPGVSPDSAPVVSLDSEGQFELLAGANLSEVLCSEYGEWADGGYDGLADACRRHGVAVAHEDPIDLDEPDVSPTPAEHHLARYRQLLAGSSDAAD